MEKFQEKLRARRQPAREKLVLNELSR
jgi:hypothetical protein